MVGDINVLPEPQQGFLPIKQLASYQL